jgi:hypothetical protein
MKSEQNCTIVTIGYTTLLGPERRRIDSPLDALSNAAEGCRKPEGDRKPNRAALGRVMRPPKMGVGLFNFIKGDQSYTDSEQALGYSCGVELMSAEGN